MLDLIVVVARFVQFTAAVVLFGTPLFFVYALRGLMQTDPAALAWGRGVTRASAGLLVLGTLTSLLAQTANMAGSPAMAFDRDALGMVLSGTQFGYAIVARLALGLGVLVLAFRLPPTHRLWLIAVGAGALILASFAWTGHGASEEGLSGAIHAASDVVHLIAAGVWLGALVALAVLLMRSRKTPLPALHQALENFSGIGSVVVAALLGSGLVNSWFLVGPTHLEGLVTSPYGWLLLAKLVLFGAMLVLAAANRFHLTPGLGQALGDATGSAAATRRLRRSIALETALGVGVLTLVSALGMLAPVSAQM